MKFFSYKNRPVHLGPFELEKLPRADAAPSLDCLAQMAPLDFTQHPPESIVHAVARYMAMLDTVRDGQVTFAEAEIPDDEAERARHFKAASYFFDSSMSGICVLRTDHFLARAINNPMIREMRAELEKGQPKSFAGGIDTIYANILAAARTALKPVHHHTHALVFLIEHAREPRPGETGTAWLENASQARSALLAANTATVIADYIRHLGFEARAHSATASDVDLGKLAVSCGLAFPAGRNGATTLENPFVGARFALAAVTTTMTFAPDKPLLARAPTEARPGRRGSAAPFENREFFMGPYPFEQIKRADEPTTFIDEDRIPRFPKRSDYFARALAGDLGKQVQDAAKGGYYVGKSPISAAARRALGALLLLQYGEARGPASATAQDPQTNAENIKAAAYYFSTDAVGLSRAPDWAYYSHNAGGEPLTPYHCNAVSLIIDQGHETMEGSSGDDWISAAQSMRAYLRFSVIGGVIAEQIRRLGYSARVHSVLDSDVMQPPLTLLSGLGEVSRIGDVILNPFLGPRLKSGAVTTSMPMVHDKPIDFGLQNFCSNCNKCARECPSGAITAGPKVMYNGYEIWRSDAEKCTRYRLTNKAGAMCGRCMKTCPWNLEGLFSDSAFRWLAINAPNSAKMLAALDDRLGRGAINPVKKWWWDIELDGDANRFVAATQVNARNLSRDLVLRHEDQTLAAYTADVMPQPYPISQPINREEGIARYKALLSPAAYKQRLAEANVRDLVPVPRLRDDTPPVFPVVIAERIDLADDVVKFVLARADGEPLPPFTAGAHIDVVIAPEYQRQYSLTGSPSDASRYIIGVQREKTGRGGSILMHKAFRAGRRLFISEPRNHFPLDEAAPLSLLMAGGIGITPLIAMANRLHEIGREFLLHYSAKSSAQCGFAEELASSPWSDRVFFHFSRDGARAAFADLIPDYRPGFRLYACGGAAYMDGVFAAASAKRWPGDALTREYFSVPETPDYENHPFRIELLRSNRVIDVPADKSAVEALGDAGVAIETKCEDGLCGVCSARYFDSNIEHRDYVLSQDERQKRVILCCSRARDRNGLVKLDL